MSIAYLVLVLHEAERLLPIGSVDHHGLSTDTGHPAAAPANTTVARVLPVVMVVVVMVAVAGAAERRGPRGTWLLLPVGL